MTVPYTFGTATTSIPLSNLDSNFNTPITLGNTSIYLGNTTTTIGNLTLTNATISSGTVNITNVTVTTANVTNITVTGTANIATGNITTLTSTSITDSGLTSGRVTYAGASGLLSDSSNFTYSGTALTVASGIFKANGAPSLSAATAGEAILAPEGTYGALLYGRGTTYDVVLGQRSTGVALGVLAGTNNVTFPGNVGIGTSSPTLALSVGVNAGVNGINHIYTGTGGPSNIATWTSDVNTGEVRFGGVLTGYFPTFYSSNTERMRISSAGLVSITGAGTEVLALNKLGGPSAYLQPVSSTDAGLQVKDSGGTVTLTVGTTGTTVALQGGTVSSGTGIAFPATQSASSNANTLDDYEEGTWTPAGGSLTNNATATYTKVGRIVYANFDISFPGGGAASQAQVSGMPFTALTPGGGGTIGFTSYIVPVTINMERGTTYFTFCTYGGGTITFANVNGERFIGTLVYTT